jgi:hypothetical protein
VEPCVDSAVCDEIEIVPMTEDDWEIMVSPHINGWALNLSL